jgi:uncharacterized protein with LGFP repeats
VRRILAGLIAFVALTGTLLVLPVYAAPLPEAHPVDTSIEEVDLGSVSEPAAEAVVVENGEVLPDGADDPGDPGEDTPSDDTPAESTPDTGAGDEDAVVSGDEIPDVPALTISRPDTEEFSTVGVTWLDDPSISDVVAQLRVKDDQGAWGEWTTLESDDAEQTPTAATDDHEVRAGTAPYWTGRSYGVEVIVQGAGGESPQDVRLTLLDPGTSSADALPAAGGPQDQAHAALAMPRIYTRAEWGADESIRGWDPEYVSTIKAATVHHTADSNNYSAADVPAILRSIYTYHTITRGWGDIGYNVIVDKFGRMFEGRYGGLTSTVVGAHAGGFNSYTFGVSMLGDYEAAPVPQATVDAVSEVIAWKFSLYGVDPQGSTVLTSGGGGTAKYAAGTRVTLPTVFGHRDVGSTACPGQYGYARLGEIRSKVVGRLSAAKNPRGSFDSASVSGQLVTANGWATDPDTTGPVTVHIYANGVGVAVVTADQTVEGVEPAHGFRTTFPLPLGTWSVCTYGINVGAGTGNSLLGCRTLTINEASFNPAGGVDASASGRDVSVSGWASDPDTSAAIPVHVYVDGVPMAIVSADRPTVTRGDHGFATTIRTTDGSHSVCAYGINVGRGTTNVLLGCRSVAVSMGPLGAYESLSADGRAVTVTGWASDPDVPAQPIAVHVYANGTGVAVLTADGSGHGGHAFSATFDLPDGTQNVCVYGINVGVGSSNTLLGCRVVEVSMNPVGALTDVEGDDASARIVGWVTDPDIPSDAVLVHVYLDGRPVAAVAAGQARTGVTGPHGYELVVPLGAPGAHNVCTYGINVGQGTTNVLLGCRPVSVTDAAFEASGTLDPLHLTGPVVTVAGTATDPDGAGAVPIHVYVDGVGRAVFQASGAPGATGTGGSFRGDVQVSPGSHTVCAYAINQGYGLTNQLLGCGTTSVPEEAYNPTGALTSATVSGGQVMFAGWAADPDDGAAATAVHVYVDGVGRTAITADQLAAGVPGPHAYQAELSVTPGQHQLCTYAINIGHGTTNVLLGCRTVTV